MGARTRVGRRAGALTTLTHANNSRPSPGEPNRHTRELERHVLELVRECAFLALMDAAWHGTGSTHTLVGDLADSAHLRT
jgi:hypothetical protein